MQRIETDPLFFMNNLETERKQSEYQWNSWGNGNYFEEVFLTNKDEEISQR